MQFDLIMSDGTTEAIELADTVFDYPFKEPLVHQIVTAYLAGARQGTRAQKNRSDVRGGGRKPWKQKGMGRARAGTIRSPLWRKGGVTFAARPQDYSQKINKKMYRAAMRAIFSELIRQKRLLITDSFSLHEPKTRSLLAKLKQLQLNQVLIISREVDTHLYLASRNLYRVAVCNTIAVTPVDLIGFDKVLLTLSAVKQIEATLA